MVEGAAWMDDSEGSEHPSLQVTASDVDDEVAEVMHEHQSIS